MVILQVMTRKVLNPVFLFITGLFLVFFPQWLSHQGQQSPEELAQRAGQAIEKKFERFNTALANMDSLLPKGKIASLLRFFEEEQIGLYRFSSDSLVFWNNSRLNPEPWFASFSKNKGIVRLNKGYCIYTKIRKGKLNDLALCFIKYEYQIQNNYLKNDFLPWTGLNKNLSFSHDTAGAYAVMHEGAVLFSFKSPEDRFTGPLLIESCTVVFFLGLILLLLALVQWQLKSARPWDLALISPLLLLVRISLSFFRWPGFLYQSVLYDVREFGNASAFLNTYLGDLLLNAIFLLISAVLFYSKSKQKHTTQRIVLYTALLFIVVLLSLLQFTHGISSLVQNSTLSFDFLSVFNMKPLAFLGVALIGLFGTALMLALMGLLNTCLQGRKLNNTVYLISCALVCGVHYSMTKQHSFLESFWLLLPALAILIFKTSGLDNFAYTLIVFLLLCSVSASYFFSQYLEKNQQSEMKLISFQLSERQDPALENEYKDLPERIKNDQRLKNLMLLLPNTRLEIPQLLKQNYFNAYFDRYTTEFYLFDKLCSPLLEHTNPIFWNQGYFEDQIKYHSDTTLSEGLYFVRTYKNGTRYIAQIKLGENRLFVVLEAKELGEQGSFPDLLLDVSQQKQEKLGNLSYAVYRFDRLVNHYGEYNYPHFTPESDHIENDGNLFKHNVFEPEEKTKVIISEKVKTTTERFTYNSYFFLIFSLVGFFLFYIYRLLFAEKRMPATLTQRIQGSIIALLLFAMTAVGITSGRLVSKQFENDNRRDLSVKSSTIVNELLNQFTPQSLFDGSQRELVNQRINEYARVFNSDLSLFDAQGRLVNTSQPKLYALGLSADLVNPSPFYAIKSNKVYSGTLTESAGNLKYLSHYTPVYDEAKQLQGFINLPYFAKQSSLLRELSGIISALINVYLVLFMLSLGSGLVLSGYITQPLRIIKQQIARISLGKRNETIQWQSNDEIGKLVSEYNQMLVKLEESATLLAQSERESAWREMAKQVAHEIKNPLTPMKLNLQYLQHLNKTSPQDFKIKFEQASAGIIEQIDSLANIATEFSNFAKLPGMQLQDIAPLEILHGAVQLYNKQPQLRIEFQASKENGLCKGDKEQCMRVFNNILSNAVEALEGTNNPKITINSQWSEAKLLVTISDNGCGIPDDLKASIFTPSFTTKSKGSGLGLAMVKNIMQGFGGKVWFESEKDKGSSFFLEFTRSSES